MAHKKIYYGEDYPTQAEIDIMNEGDVWFVVGELGTIILFKDFDVANGAFADIDFTLYKDNTLNTTTHGLSYNYSNNKLSIKSTNSKNNGTNNACDFGVRTTNAIAMPIGGERLVIEYDQGPEKLNSTKVISPSFAIIPSNEWNPSFQYTPYYGAGVTNAIGFFNQPDLVSGNVTSNLFNKGTGATSAVNPKGSVVPYSLPTMSHMKITLLATTFTVEKDGVVLWNLPHAFAGKNIYFCLGNCMFENGSTIEVAFDNLKITKYS